MSHNLLDLEHEQELRVGNRVQDSQFLKSWQILTKSDVQLKG
jgi:hypothetical protein